LPPCYASSRSLKPGLGKDRAIARAAATIARIGEIKKSCVVLDAHSSIDVKSQFAFLLTTLNVEASKIAQAFISATNINHIYWLGISLGEFSFHDFDNLTQEILFENLFRLINLIGI